MSLTNICNERTEGIVMGRLYRHLPAHGEEASSVPSPLQFSSSERSGDVEVGRR